MFYERLSNTFFSRLIAGTRTQQCVEAVINDRYVFVSGIACTSPKVLFVPSRKTATSEPMRRRAGNSRIRYAPIGSYKVMKAFPQYAHIPKIIILNPPILHTVSISNMVTQKCIIQTSLNTYSKTFHHPRPSLPCVRIDSIEKESNRQ